VQHRSVFSQDQYNAFFTDPAATPFTFYFNIFGKNGSYYLRASLKPNYRRIENENKERIRIN
jgi:hypothetical protein